MSAWGSKKGGVDDLKTKLNSGVASIFLMPFRSMTEADFVEFRFVCVVKFSNFFSFIFDHQTQINSLFSFNKK